MNIYDKANHEKNQNSCDASTWNEIASVNAGVSEPKHVYCKWMKLEP